jgi:hypothetical protein
MYIIALVRVTLFMRFQTSLIATNRNFTRLPEWPYFIRDGFWGALSSCRHSLLIILGGYLPSVPCIVKGRLQRRFGWRGQYDFKPRCEYLTNHLFGHRL